jgi:hypothetical protein
MMTKCQKKWFETVTITNPSCFIILCSEMQVRLKVAAAVVEQKRSEKQKLFSHDDGRLIHTLDEMEIHCLYMGHHNLSNKRIIIDNMRSVEKRKETVWQKMANMWNDENFASMTMALSPKLMTQFVNCWVITFDSCLDYSVATPDKQTNFH